MSGIPEEDRASRANQSIGWPVFIFAGLCAAFLCNTTVRLVHGPWRIELPEAYHEVSSELENEIDGYFENRLKAAKLLEENYQQNFCMFLLLTSCAVTIPYGLLVGWKNSGWMRGIAAASVGAASSAAMTFCCGSWLTRMPRQLFTLDMDSLLKGMLIHWTTWVVIGISLMLTLFVARQSRQVALRTVVGLFFGSAIGVVLAVMLSATFEKQEHVELQMVSGAWSQFWLAVLPVSCAGLMLGFMEADGGDFFGRE